MADTGEVLAEVLTTFAERGFDNEAANVVDGLFAIARSLDGVAYALRALGNADAATPMGAIEALGVVLKEGFLMLAERRDGPGE